MRCPSCSQLESKVVDSRPSDDGTSIRRRRECLECGTRFTTYERTEENPLVVVKSDGSSEVYDRQKLFRGLLIACAKRSVETEAIDALITDIENELRSTGKREVASKELGEMVLQRLGNLDEVAYIRFASVYKDFKSIAEFQGALNEIEG